MEIKKEKKLAERRQIIRMRKMLCASFNYTITTSYALDLTLSHYEHNQQSILEC